jgi:hypothetical protein
MILSRPNFRSICPIFATLQFCLISAFSQEPGQEFRVDRFSGVTVATQDQAMSMVMFRHKNAPMVGERAPDSILIDGESGEKTTIHTLVNERPLVMIFGSSSCNNFDLYFPDIAKFQKQYGGQFDFALIYIREAHPKGGFMPKTFREGAKIDVPAVEDARTVRERRKQALDLQKHISPEMKVYVDTLDDETGVRWGAWPQRIFVVGADHKLLYSGGPGPWHFKLTRSGWHTRAPIAMESEFSRMPFTRTSLEEFLSSYSAENEAE